MAQAFWHGPLLNATRVNNSPASERQYSNHWVEIFSSRNFWAISTIASRTFGRQRVAGWSSDALPAASLDATLRPADLKDDGLLSDTPSPSRRASRAFTRFLIVAFMGVGCTLAWQSYGEAAKQKLARWAPQLGWVQLLPALKPPPGAGFVAERPSPPVQESPPDSPHAQPAPDMAAPTAPAAPFPVAQQQLDAISRDLAAVRQSVDQLAVAQEQMARDISLQAAEKDIRHRISVPSPTPVAAPAARKPMAKPPPQIAPQPRPPAPPPMPPPVQPAPQISAAPPPAALPSPVPEISAAPPGPPPSRPHMPESN
jgi:hypothetical protein